MEWMPLPLISQIISHWGQFCSVWSLRSGGGCLWYYSQRQRLPHNNINSRCSPTIGAPLNLVNKVPNVGTAGKLHPCWCCKQSRSAGSPSALTGTHRLVRTYLRSFLDYRRSGGTPKQPNSEDNKVCCDSGRHQLRQRVVISPPTLSGFTFYATIFSPQLFFEPLYCVALCLETAEDVVATSAGTDLSGLSWWSSSTRACLSAYRPYYYLKVVQERPDLAIDISVAAANLR